MLKEPGEKGPNAIRGAMMPGWNAPAFADHMGSEAVLDYVRGFLNVEKEDLMMPDADCILYVGHEHGVDRAQGWRKHTRNSHIHSLFPGASERLLVIADRDSQEYMRGGFDEQNQREQFERLNSPVYWDQVGPYGGAFDPNVGGSGGLFGHVSTPAIPTTQHALPGMPLTACLGFQNTYIENNPGAQWCRWETALVDHEWNSGVEYVAGSHRRWRTDFENEVLLPETVRVNLLHAPCSLLLAAFQ